MQLVIRLLLLVLIEFTSQTQQLLLNALLVHYFLLSILRLGQTKVTTIVREDVFASRRCIPILMTEELGLGGCSVPC